MNSIKKRIYRGLLGVVRLDRSRALERQAVRVFLRFRPNHLTALRKWAEYSEASGSLWDALAAWQRISDQTEFSSTKKYRKAQSKIAELSRLLYKDQILSASGSPDGDVLDVSRLTSASISALSLKFDVHEKHQSFVEKIYSQLRKNDQHHARLTKIYELVSRLDAGEYDAVEADIIELLNDSPGDRTLYRLLYKLYLTRVAEQLDLERDGLARWWAFFESKITTLPQPVVSDVMKLSTRFALIFFRQDRMADAEAVVAPIARFWPDDEFSLRMLARIAEHRRDWRAAAGYWQFLAAVKNPITTKNRAVVASRPQEMLRISKGALRELRNARVNLALELLEHGKRREFSELVGRVVESIPDQRILKKERAVVDLVRAYVDCALHDDGIVERPVAGGPKKIVICLDVMKISDIHTHSRIIFAMSKNLLAIDPQIEVHVVITNERFTVTLPALAPSFTRSNEEKLRDLAQAFLGDLYNTRFHIHYYRGNGIEGLIQSCKSILALEPDVILYGGGHRGLFSNESRLVRHALFNYVPTAYFFIQSNNQVDEKIDMIIARGPHAIEGEAGGATVRIQPYPTIVEDLPVIVPNAVDQQESGRTVVSALAGVRMDFKMNALDDKVLRELFSILDENPGVVWHVIGASNPKKLVADNPTIAKRVLTRQVVVHPVLAFDVFTELVSRASLFLHLPGFTGGSGGASVARRSGVPILTFSHSDVSGRQPPVTVFQEDDVSGYVALAKKLLAYPDERQKIVELQIAHSAWIRETSAQGFYDCLAEAIEIYRCRKAGSSSVSQGIAAAPLVGSPNSMEAL
jgi:hypothetical protein